MYDSMLKPAFVFDGRKILNHSALSDIGFHVETIGKRPGESFQVCKKQIVLSGVIWNRFPMFIYRHKTGVEQITFKKKEKMTFFGNLVQWPTLKETSVDDIIPLFNYVIYSLLILNLNH